MLVAVLALKEQQQSKFIAVVVLLLGARIQLKYNRIVIQQNCSQIQHF
jgi:hypothetical protein